MARRAGVATCSVVAACCALAAAVTTSCAPTRTPVDFTLPSSDPNAVTAPFLATPWPSDVMKTATGLDLSTIPNPFHSGELEDAIHLIETNQAYAATTTIYFHVPGGVDESSLPQTPQQSLAPAASMFLVELISGVPPTPVPIEWKHFAKATSFLPAGTVAVQPLLGAVPRTRFALVVTSNARAKNGSALGPSPDLLALLTCAPQRSGTRAVECGVYAELVRALQVPPEDVALVDIVTPADSTSGLAQAAADVHALGPPLLTSLTKRPPSGTLFDVYDGSAQIAQLQAGVPPFLELDKANNYRSGGFQFDDDGHVIIQRFEDVPFIVTVPKNGLFTGCAVLYGHGTGGDKESGIDDGTADQLALTGCAMLGAPEPLHKERAGFVAGEEETNTFNFFNPVAGRDNWRQSAIEKVQWTSLMRAFPSTDFHIDPTKVAYFGHSQGGIAGALFVAVDRDIKGAFLSGAGAGFQASLVLKTDPVKIADVLKTVLFLPNSEDVDLFHPVIALLQTYVDAADPINYGPLWHDRGSDVPSLVMTSGLQDTYTPPPCHDALAASWGIPQVKPIVSDIPVLDVLGVKPVDEAKGDFVTATGAHITAGMLQYENEGHFAVFDDPDNADGKNAQAAFREFFRTLQAGTPSVHVQQQVSP